MNKALEYKLSKLPHKPGIYLWKDYLGNVIYVGKAINIFKRAHQYFNSNNYKTLLIKNIEDIDFVVVENENEALVLEANLINKYQPKYNVLLKTNNGYPYIVVTNEPHPRLIYTKDLKKYKGKYYGPFASVKQNCYKAYCTLLKIFPLRKCATIKKSKCLFYDIGQCLGPCINNIRTEDYKKYTDEITNFFKGKNTNIINELHTKEKEFSNNLDFENAKTYFDLSHEIKNASKELAISQNISMRTKKDEDIVGFYIKNNIVGIIIFSYKHGKLLTKHNQILDIYSDIEQTIYEYLRQYYFKILNPPIKVYVNLSNKYLKQLHKLLKTPFVRPNKGKHLTILQTAAKNAKSYIDTNYLIFQHEKDITDNAFEEFKTTIGINNLTLIHVFDMSNLFDKNKIGAVIALENGKFNKNLYRKFIIDNEQANSDYEYMYEVVKRMYTKTLREKMMLPNLIIVDGGKQQISAATKALKELSIENVVPVIGLAKDNNHQTTAMVFPNGQSMKLDRKSNIYSFLSNIQENVHRYAVTFFRKKNINSFFRSTLNNIPGIGKRTIDKLLQQYDNVANIKKASVNELSQYVSKTLAKAIKENI